MSRAIRHELMEHGRTLRDIPDEALSEYVQIVGAFYGDLAQEYARRQEGHGSLDLTASARAEHYDVRPDEELASELGVPYATHCQCGHVVVFSDAPIPLPQVLPCCEAGWCERCVTDPRFFGYEHAEELHP